MSFISQVSTAIVLLNKESIINIDKEVTSMSAIKVVLGFGAALVLFLFLSLGVVSAHDLRTGDNIVTQNNEVIDQSLFVFANTIDVNSEVFGDVFCAGQTINISGKVHGDILCAGQTINISGQVDGDVRLAGQSINISGSVDGNASLAAQTVTLQSGGQVDGDITTAAQDVILNGAVGRDVSITSSNAVIANTVGRDVSGSIESLKLTSNAVVSGDIDYTSKNELDKAEGATVAGTVTITQPESSSGSSATLFGVAIAWFIYLFLALLFTSMVIALLFPTVLQSTTDRVIKSPWKALLVGFVASIVMPAVLIVLGITLIGFPLMVLLGLIWLVVATLSGPFTGYYLGRLLLPKTRSVLLTMFVGSVVLLAIYFVPFVGVFALALAYWLGTGMILLELMRRTPKPAYEVVSEPEVVSTQKTPKPVSKSSKTTKKK